MVIKNAPTPFDVDVRAVRALFSCSTSDYMNSVNHAQRLASLAYRHNIPQDSFWDVTGVKSWKINPKRLPPLPSSSCLRFKRVYQTKTLDVDDCLNTGVCKTCGVLLGVFLWARIFCQLCVSSWKCCCACVKHLQLAPIRWSLQVIRLCKERVAATCVRHMGQLPAFFTERLKTDNHSSRQ